MQKTKKKKIQTAKPQLVSFFCGPGGLDTGFRRAGFHTAFALDLDRSAVLSFNRNYPGQPAIQGDLVTLGVRGTMKRVRKEIAPGTSIGVIGGPPCQGFSQANVTASIRDPRNGLASLYLKVVKALCRCYRVEFLVLENVSGLLSRKYRARYASIKRDIRALGFQLFETTLNAADFGVPQSRRRLFLIGLKRKDASRFSFPDGNANVRRTVRDAIGGIPGPAYFSRGIRIKDIPIHRNHWTMKPRSERFRSAMQVNGSWRSFKKLAWDKPSRTVAFGNREILIHPQGRRRISIYEAMLLQGFPKSYQLLGHLSSQVTQVSNAVPPPLAFAVARNIRRALLPA